MPISGGGGSHSGGSHSSGGYSRSSGGSHRSSGDSYEKPQIPRYSRSYYPGTYRYVYYDRVGNFHNYYGTRKVKKPSKVGTLFKIILWVMVALAGSYLCTNIRKTPKKIVEHPAPAVICDETGMFSQADRALSRLQAFTDETGITACITGITNESWQEHYSNMETCAYDTYLKTFSNEDSLLILYSQPETVDPAFNDWYYEIMYGENTVPLLKEEKIDALREGIRAELVHGDDAPELAISAAITQMGQGMMDSYNEWAFGVLGGLLILLAILMIKKAWSDYLRRTYECQAVQVKIRAKELTCPQCGAKYIDGSLTACRSCSAPLMLPEKSGASAEE